jgi:phosphoribosylamine--glycine ligase
VAGIVDEFKGAGLKIFGPTMKASRLEGSKHYAKEFLVRHQIPTAAYATFTDAKKAAAYVQNQSMPIVVKADGLAYGKGVILAHTEEDALKAVSNMLEGQAFGEAGKRILIEEFVSGEEASFICMVDGKNVLPLATSQDHKSLGDGDTGPNTGGMGAYSPTPVVTPKIYRLIMRDIIEPTVAGMAAEGNPYTGFLYAGLMIGADSRPKVLEFNCRLGDPETQPILLRLQSDLVELCLAALSGGLTNASVQWDPRAALGVVMAAGGYPGSYNKGDVIRGLPQRELANIKVFHAGTSERDGEIVTNGGRVLCVTALAQAMRDAQAHAYGLVRAIYWDGLHFRTDIGYRAVKRGE